MGLGPEPTYEHKSSETQRQWEECRRFDKYTGGLGIIPKALKDMLRSQRNDGVRDYKAEREKISLLSRTLFSHSFSIWNDRSRRDAAWPRLLTDRKALIKSRACDHLTHDRKCHSPIPGIASETLAMLPHAPASVHRHSEDQLEQSASVGDNKAKENHNAPTLGSTFQGEVRRSVRTAQKLKSSAHPDIHRYPELP